MHACVCPRSLPRSYRNSHGVVLRRCYGNAYTAATLQGPTRTARVRVRVSGERASHDRVVGRRGRRVPAFFLCACVAPPSVLVRERPRAVASVISPLSARHTDAAHPRGQQVGHALAPRHLLGVGRVELPKACRVNAQGRGDRRAATLVGPIRAPPPTPGAAGGPWLHRVDVRGARRAVREARVEGGGTAGVRPAAKNSRCSSLTSGRGRKSARARGRRR